MRIIVPKKVLYVNDARFIKVNFNKKPARAEILAGYKFLLIISAKASPILKMALLFG